MKVPRNLELNPYGASLRRMVLLIVMLACLSPHIYATGACGNTPNFNTGQTFVAGATLRAAVVGDFNGDGNQDLAAADVETDYIYIMLGDGAGGFGSITQRYVGNRPAAIEIGDFNGDNKLDLAVSCLTSPPFYDPNVYHPTVFILLGDNAGGFTQTSFFPSSGGVESLVAADFNSDGHADLALESPNGGGVLTLRLGDGNGNFTAAGSFNLGGGSPDRIIARDLNGDGKPDIVATDFYRSQILVLLNNGAGGFAGAASFNTGGGSVPGSTGVTAGDFNSDGKLDLAVANYGNYPLDEPKL